MKTIALVCFAAALFPLQLMADDPAALRKERDKLIQRGLWRDALDFYGQKLMPISDELSGNDLERAIDSLGRLGTWVEFDGLVEGAVAAHAENPALLLSAAVVYGSTPHFGRLVAGDFKRDGGRYFGGGRGMNPNADPEASAGSSVDASGSEGSTAASTHATTSEGPLDGTTGSTSSDGTTGSTGSDGTTGMTGPIGAPPTTGEVFTEPFSEEILRR